ncbi:MAG: hypothetical protein A2Y77_17965 [Planctomycetes bacterium RBG_13_62_9]|nr:MAG: hypothetical protein A2Y77_17965 [Planctomycetes bacterium RBG_13_62_9]
MEMIPVVDDALDLKGFAERKWAEKKGLCHLTTLLIPIIQQRGRRLVTIQVRDWRKSFPCCRDVFGGHVAMDKEFWLLLMGVPFDLPELVMAAAVREANEELRMCNKNTGHPCILDEKDLRRVGAIGEAQWTGKGNVERSTIFLVAIRQECCIHPMDDIEGVFHPVKTQDVDWQQLRRRFRENKQYACEDRERAKKVGCARNKKEWQFADGAARILKDKRLFDLVSAAILGLSDRDFATE